MTQEYDKTIQDLLEWNICERNSDEELKPTADFLVWYYDYLIHSITESYGEEWEEIDDGESKTEKEQEEMDERDAEKEEFVKDCIENQIVMWTSQRVGKKLHANIEVKKHVEVVHRLINEIESRLMDNHMRKIGGGNKGK